MLVNVSTKRFALRNSICLKGQCVGITEAFQALVLKHYIIIIFNTAKETSPCKIIMVMNAYQWSIGHKK